MKKIICILLIVLMSFSMFNIYPMAAGIYMGGIEGAYCYECECTMEQVFGLICTGGLCEYKCKNCGDYKLISPKHSNYPFDIERNEEEGLIIYSCGLCGFSYTKLISEHKCENFIKLSTVEPTCTSPGRKGEKRCVECGLIVGGVITEPALGHMVGYALSGVAPTCTEIGYTNTFRCGRKNCGFFREREPIPALGHTPVLDEAIKPTCTESGLTEGSHCQVCNEIIIKQEIVSKIEHTSEGDWIEINKPSDTKNGLKVKYCSQCKGVAERDYYSEKCDHAELILEAITQSCTENGLTEGISCSICDEILLSQEIIPATGHTEIVDKSEEPTCTESGITEGKHCTNCQEVLVSQEVIPPKGHDVYILKAVNPTCKKTGLTEGKKCLNCNEIIVVQNIIQKNPNEHNLIKVGKVEATYFSKGWSGAEICQDCGDIVVARKATPKLKLKTPKATVKVNKKKIIVKYKKVKDAKGFEVKYKYKGKVIKKSYTTQKAKTIAFKNLKKGTYKVYVRAFTKQGTKKAYSNWSQVKKVKIK